MERGDLRMIYGVKRFSVTQKCTNLNLERILTNLLPKSSRNRLALQKKQYKSHFEVLFIIKR